MPFNENLLPESAKRLYAAAERRRSKARKAVSLAPDDVHMDAVDKKHIGEVEEVGVYLCFEPQGRRQLRDSFECTLEKGVVLVLLENTKVQPVNYFGVVTLKSGAAETELLYKEYIPKQKGGIEFSMVTKGKAIPRVSGKLQKSRQHTPNLLLKGSVGPGGDEVPAYTPIQLKPALPPDRLISVTLDIRLEDSACMHRMLDSNEVVVADIKDMYKLDVNATLHG